jgi:hypothetical protein
MSQVVAEIEWPEVNGSRHAEKHQSEEGQAKTLTLRAGGG